ncbi:MAG: hypothetical protein ACFFCQ_03985 [Promethearchaeota archaeon]
MLRKSNVKLPRPLIISTTDFRFFMAISRELNQRRIGFNTVPLGDPVPPNSIILTTIDEFPEVNQFYNDSVLVLSAKQGDFPSYEQLIVELFISMHGRRMFKNVAIGIDPGHHSTGIVVDADGMILVAETMLPSQIGLRLKKILKHFITVTTTIKIGSGAPDALIRLINSIIEYSPESIDLLQWVEESGTTSSESNLNKTNGLTKDEKSALRISKRKGKSGSIPEFIKNITPGKIKEIQNWSRQLSCDITISQELAKRVLKGEISLEEAIKHQRLRGDNIKDQSAHH